MNNNYASLGRQFMRLLIENNDFSAVARNKVTESLLHAEEVPMFQYIRSYHDNRRTYGMLPTIEDLDDLYPAMGLSTVRCGTNDIDQIAHKLHESALSSELRTTALKVTELAMVSPYRAMDYLTGIALTLPVKHNRESNDLILSESADVLCAELERTFDSDGLAGAPWAWESLNRATGGKEQGTLNLIYGRPKSGKTHTKLYDAVKTYECGYGVLWCNTEMQAKKQMLRAAAALKEWSYQALSKEPTRAMIDELRLTLETLRSLALEEAEMSPDLPPSVGTFRITDVYTVEDVRAKILETKAPIVYIDTANELQLAKGPKREHERQREIVRQLRAMTRDRDLGNPCIICSVHANREGDKEIARGYSEIGGSDQWARSCDTILRNIRLKDPNTDRWVQAVLPPGSGGREMVWDGMLINFSPYDNMTYLRETSREEVVMMLEIAEERAAENARAAIEGEDTNTDAPSPTGIPRHLNQRRMVPMAAGWANAEDE